MIPRRRPGQSFASHQAEVALWMGYPDAEAMNRAHDALHAALCHWLNVPSQSLRQAAGRTLTTEQEFLAHLEEVAVLHTQRFMRHVGAEVPR
jgi:hypothetical protein